MRPHHPSLLTCAVIMLTPLGAFALLLMTMCPSAYADLPQIDTNALLEAVNFADSLLENVVCTYSVDERSNKALPGIRLPPDRRLEIEWRQQRPREYLDVTIHDGTFIRDKPVRLINAFNGEKRTQWVPNENKGDVFAEAIEHAWPVPVYCGMTVGKLGKNLGEFLAESEIKTLSRQHWQGHDCYFVEAIQPDGARAELWIDPNAGWRARRTRLYTTNGLIAYETSTSEFRDCNNAIWFPVKCTSMIYAPAASSAERVVSVQSTFTVAKLKVNAPLTQNDFEVKFPQGTDVYDHIYGIGYVVGVTSLQGLDDARLDKIADAAKKSTAASPNNARGGTARKQGSSTGTDSNTPPSEQSTTSAPMRPGAKSFVLWSVAIIAAGALSVLVILALARSRRKA